MNFWLKHMQSIWKKQILNNPHNLKNAILIKDTLV